MLHIPVLRGGKPYTSVEKVDRLNLGAIPTTRIGWDQPHEGNLFDHLYGRRAIQRVA